MPRKARIDAPGALHHIIVRGIEKKAIFKDSIDYRNFIDRFGRILLESRTPCFAWALMSNHAHLLLKTGMAPLATVMRRLLTGYAQQFNRRHRRHGHLFQNRYKSILCEEDSYLLELVRYIHLNPIRAGIVRDVKALKTYPFTGHSPLMGKADHQWQDTAYVLKLFNPRLSSARKAYSQFVFKGITFGSRPELVGGGLIRSMGGWAAVKSIRSVGMRVVSDERILGSSDFAETVLKESSEAYDMRTRTQAMGLDLDVLTGLVSNRFEISKSIVQSASKHRAASRSRAIACYLAVERLGYKGAEVAQYLNLTPSAVSKLVYRGRMDEITEAIEKEILK
jgi:putative transposase